MDNVSSVVQFASVALPDMSALPDTIKFVLALLSGGGIVQLVKVLGDRSQARMGGDADIRKDLMKQVEGLRTYVDKLRGEVLEWTDRYYEVLSEKIALQTINKDLESNNRRLLDELTELNAKLEVASSRLDKALAKLRRLSETRRTYDE